MPPKTALGIEVRDAGETDLPALTAIKGSGSEAVHRDRLGDARGGGFRYLVLLADQELIGYTCLVFRRPAHWSDTEDQEHLPQIVDLRVKESHRGLGYGRAFIHHIERITSQAVFEQLYLAVEPQDNPRAYALYLQLGYQPLQTAPYQKAWEFIDSAGSLHHGEDWVVDMVKQVTSLASPS
jgi:GNAT superfamily N-acetyltransferase